VGDDDFRDRVFRTIEIFSSKGAQVTFDPNIRFELLKDRPVEEIVGPVLRRCSILFPGEKELLLLSGGRTVDESVERLIVLKKGSRGCTVFSANTRVHVPAFRIREVDPTGAGDCFDAGFLCGLRDGKDPEESARVAAAVGALNARAFGPMEGKISPRAVQSLLSRR